jgi:biotin synthase
VKEAGLKVCTGGILGLGESWEQRVELAFEIKGVDPDSVPVNSLVPIKGTRMEGRSPIPPMDLLKALAIFRLVMPSKSISVAAGREQNLRDLRSMIFQAGASGMMIGNFLTITGRKVEDDLQMLVDLGLEHDVMR